MRLECSPWQPMRLTLTLVMTKRVMVVVTAVMMILKTTQTRAIILLGRLQCAALLEIAFSAPLAVR